MNLKNGKVFTNKFVGTGPLSYEKRIYRAAVSQKLRNTALDNHSNERERERERERKRESEKKRERETEWSYHDTWEQLTLVYLSFIRITYKYQYQENIRKQLDSLISQIYFWG